MSVLWRLPLPMLLALRYLRSTRKDAFVSFLSAVAAGGIGLGVAALVLALAALAGLQEALRGEVLARTPHLEVELPPGAPAAALHEELLALPGVVAVQEAVRGRGWLQHASVNAAGAIEGALVQPVEIVGYSGMVPRFFPGAEGGAPGLYISSGLATRWAVERGAVMTVVSPRPTLTPFGPQPRMRSLPLAGTFDSGRTEDVERIALPLGVARPLAGNPSTFLEVTGRGLDEALALVPAVRKLLPADAQVRTWEQLNRPLFFALRLEKSVMFVAVSLIVLVAAMALVADLALVITNKRQELGMLATMGETPRRLRRAFLWLGTLIAGLGIATGALLGAGAALLLDRYQLVQPALIARGIHAVRYLFMVSVLRLSDPGPWSAGPQPVEQIFFLDYLPFRLEAPDIASVLAVTLALALGSSLWVAQRVSKLSPVEALRR